jgi:hypothetical protein
MALPTTNISMSALQTEFGGSNPISMSEYVRGGAYVPSGTTSAYGTIPTTTSNISLGLFRGTSKLIVATLTTGNNNIYNPGGKGVAYYTLDSYGYTTGGTFVDVPDGFYSLSYPAFGSMSGLVAGSTGTTHTVVECIYHFFTNETPLFNKQLIITVTGNLTNKTYTPYIDSSAIAGAKTGNYNGSTTTFRWDEGTTNTGSTIPGNDTSTPDSNPFGSNGTTHTLQLL